MYPENEKSLPDQDVWTVQRILQWSADWLKRKDHGPLSNPRLDAEVLLSSVLDMDRMQLYLQLDRPLSKAECERFKSFLLDRGSGVPVAYLVGYRDFYRHRFKVNRHTLIPRPDTELLVEAAVQHLRSINSPKVLDIGTGSGCIAISLAAELPGSQVVAWDVSDEALLVAADNVEVCGVKNVKFIKQDALRPEAFKDHVFDALVSNPPYIPWNEKDQCATETLKYEPSAALFASDADGLTFYRAFASFAQAALNEGGKIFLEFGVSQAEKVAPLFEAQGWRKIVMMKDLSGRDRVLCAERP